MRPSTLVIFFLMMLISAISTAQQFDRPQFLVTGTSGVLPYDLATCDFNNDGNPDFAVAGFDARAVAVFLGKGDGTFTPPRPLYVNMEPVSVACGDVNEDGNMDLLVDDSDAGKADIFLGDGTGKFSKFASYPLPEDPFQLRTADFDGDGHLDFAITFGVSQNLGVIVEFGNGDGTFGRPATYNLAGTPTGIAIGDVNGDGRPDLAITNKTPAVLLLINQGNGTFANGNSYNVANQTYSVVLADLNHDGKLDLLVGSWAQAPDALTVQLGNGDGSFGSPVLYPTSPIGTAVRSIAVADFNGDGNLDVVTANEIGAETLFYGNGDGTLQSAVGLLKGTQGSISAATADFNRDGFPDAIFGTQVVLGTYRIAVLINAQ